MTAGKDRQSCAARCGGFPENERRCKNLLDGWNEEDVPIFQPARIDSRARAPMPHLLTCPAAASAGPKGGMPNRQNPPFFFSFFAWVTKRLFGFLRRCDQRQTAGVKSLRCGFKSRPALQGSDALRFNVTPQKSKKRDSRERPAYSCRRKGAFSAGDCR